MATQPLVQIRACRKCGVEKPDTVDFFFRKTGGHPGLRPKCQDCTRGVAGYSDAVLALRTGGQSATVRQCRKCAVEKPFDRDHFVLKLGKLTPLCRECNKADCQRRFFEKHEARVVATKPQILFWRAASAIAVRGQSFRGIGVLYYSGCRLCNCRRRP